MNKQFEQLMERKGNGSMKWEAAYIAKRFSLPEEEQEEIFPLFIADMDYQIDETIHQKWLEKLAMPDLGYFHIQESYYDSIIHWQKAIHDITILREWIVASIGTITSLNIACELFARDQKILIMTPVYGSFRNCTAVGKQVNFPLTLRNNRYEIAFDALEEVLKAEGVKALLFCNPHNPSGRMWSYEELEQLVLLCKKYEVLLLSDEIHSELCLTKERFVSLIEFTHLYKDIIVSTSPNKTFNISGLSTSYLLCAKEELRTAYQGYLDHLHLSCNRMGIELSEIVYTYGLAWQKRLVANIKQKMALVKACLQDSGMELMEPDCGYLLWVRLPGVEDVEEFVVELAKHTHVLIETGSRFLDHYEGWVRINTATSTAILQEAMLRLKTFYLNWIDKD